MIQDRKLLGKDETALNGIQILSAKDRKVSITQGGKIDKVKKATTEQPFASQRTLDQYIGDNVRPEICAAVQPIAPGNEPTTARDFKSLKKATLFIQGKIDQGLSFSPLDLATMRMVIFTDVSCANEEGLKSQLEYVLLLADSSSRCNIVYYGSNQCKRIARPVMAAEIHALVLGFDLAYAI